MEKNPFNQLLGLIDERSEKNRNAKDRFYIGIVTSPLPNLKIAVSGIEIDKDNIYIDKWLLDRNRDDLKTETSLTGDNEHTHNIKDKVQNKLAINDRVVMLRDNDFFYILSKVVRL